MSLNEVDRNKKSYNITALLYSIQLLAKETFKNDCYIRVIDCSIRISVHIHRSMSYSSPTDTVDFTFYNNIPRFIL